MKSLITLLLTTHFAFGALTVINTNDSGPGSLRDAFNQVNASTNDSETILFNIPGSGVHIIKPATPLPYLTNTVVINGYSQPGAQPNTLVEGDNAVIEIEVDGQLLLGGGGSEVYGLSVQAIQLQGYGDVIQGNFIGADPSGTNRIANASGLYLRAAFAHQIGGVHPADRNLISGNTSGIQGFGAQNPLGDPLPATRIEGNYIGTDRTGTRPLRGQGLGNDGAGISIAAPDQIIGGTEPGAGNIIAFNSQGVSVGGRASNHLIEGNSIFANTSGGIYGGNPGPLITSATPGSRVVKGTVTGTPGRNYRVEVFSNDACDPSGFGQGKTLIGVGTASVGVTGEGTFSANVATPLSAGLILTATATPEISVDEGTTGFSRCIPVSNPLELELTVSGPSGAVAASGNASYIVTVANKSGETATGVSVVAKLPANLNPGSLPAGWTNNTVYPKNSGPLNVVSTVLPSLAPGASVSATISFKPTLIGSYVSSFQVVGGQPDENQANNEVQLTTAVFNPAPRQLAVTNSASSGPGSLDQAISDANAGVGGDTIVFNIPGAGLHRITNSFFSSATVPVTIDGYTQPGAKPNTLATGDNAVLEIELTRGTLLFQGGSSTVRGLVLPGILFNGQPGLTGGSNVVEGCFIGTDPTGLRASTNVDDSLSPIAIGIIITGADDTRIGGAGPAQRNILSGMVARQTAGGTPAVISTDAARTVVQGNYIGTDATGENPIGNDGAGVLFSSGSQGRGPVAGGTVGGLQPGEGNVIAYNNGSGVSVVDPTSGVSILGNAIFGNSALGIGLGRLRVTVFDEPLTGGVNRVGVAPTLTAVSQSVAGTRAQGYIQAKSNESYRLEFYASPTNANAFVQSEGKVFLGSQSIKTDGTGRAAFDVTVAASSGLVSATATDAAGTTSPFATFQPPSREGCVKTGDLLAGLLYGDVVGTNVTLVHSVQARDPAGKPLGMFYRRAVSTSSPEYSSREVQAVRDVAVANDAVWVVESANGTVSRTSLCGEALGVFLRDTNAPPYALTFDASGNVYVGFNSTNNNVRKYDATGKLLDQYSVRCDYTSLGVQGMDLAADQHTLFYGSYGPKIHRYDLAAHQQLADFATNVFGSDFMRVLPDGGLITADQRWVRRYDASGHGVWTNRVNGKYWWTSIRLDPDLKTFWGLDLSPVAVHFDLATGAFLQALPLDVHTGGEQVGGLGIVGEPAAGRNGGLTEPTLRVSFNGQQAVLTWSASPAGYLLQSSARIAPAPDWQTVTATPTVVNGQYTVAVSPSEHTRFYRLVKP